MKLEKGKRYVRRDGNITGALQFREEYPEDPQPWFDSAFDFWYFENGKGWATELNHPEDLISEYVEPSAKTDREKLCALFNELDIGYILTSKRLINLLNSPARFVFKFDEQGNLIRGDGL